MRSPFSHALAGAAISCVSVLSEPSSFPVAFLSDFFLPLVSAFLSIFPPDSRARDSTHGTVGPDLPFPSLPFPSGDCS